MSQPRLVPTPAALSVAVALAVSGGLINTESAHAAGLGRLTVQSALGQPLRAEVEITSLSQDESSSLKAALASPDAFRQAGLEFNPALTGLNFRIDRRADGRAVVRISSARPINEPFVDLLVELNWASGKFAREYTFLLDPPELRVGKEDSVSGGAATSTPVAPTAAVAQSPAPAPTPVVVPAPAPAPVAKAPTPAVRAPKPVVPAPVARAAAPRPAAPDSVKVGRGDTLARIARKVKPADVSLNQAIVAIYQANPRAFFGGVHQMRAGTTLEIPAADTMSALSRADVNAEMRASRKAFDAYRAKLADAAKPLGGEQGGQKASGSIAEAAKPAEDTSAGDQLKLSKGGADGSTAAGGAAGAKSAAVETAVARDNAVRESQARIDELEKNVSDLQKLLELKNQQLSDVEGQLEQARNAAKSASGSISSPVSPDTSAAGQASTGAPASIAEKPSASADDGAPAQTPATPADDNKSEPAKPGQTSAATGTAPADDASMPAAGKPLAEAPAPTPVAGDEPAPQQGSFLDQLRENPYVLLGGGALVLLGGFYAWYSRRRRKTADKFEDSLGGTDAFTANSLFGTTGGQNVDTSNSLFSTNIRDSGVDVHSTEVDPIAEAEVYIAYGREAQAEEILKEALKKQPERHAIRLKLLEIYAGRKDVASFNALAGEMYEQSGGTNEEWPKVVTLGLSIDPDNSLYTGRADPAADQALDEDGDDSGTGAGPGAVAAAAAAAAAAGALGTAGLMDALNSPSEAESTQTSDAEPDAISDLDFQMPEGFSEPSDTVRARAEAVELKSSDSSSDLDFDIDVDSRIISDDAVGSVSQDADFPTLDVPGSNIDSDQAATELSQALEGKIDLPSLDLGAGSTGFEDSGSRRGDALADLGDLNVDIPSLETLRGPAEVEPSAVDLSAIGLDLSPESVSGPAVGGDANRWQEMATKLDLASAYEEIGDKEGARELLEEVVRGGDSEQQQKARAMLSKIN